MHIIIHFPHTLFGHVRLARITNSLKRGQEPKRPAHLQRHPDLPVSLRFLSVAGLASGNDDLIPSVHAVTVISVCQSPSFNHNKHRADEAAVI
jgi:hypothetical protein